MQVDIDDSEKNQHLRKLLVNCAKWKSCIFYSKSQLLFSHQNAERSRLGFVHPFVSDF